MKTKQDIKKKSIKSQSIGLSNSKIVTRFTLKEILDGRRKFLGKRIKKISKVLFPILVVIACASLTYNLINIF